MGLLKLLATAASSANPAEDWLRKQYPDLFRNGERLPAQPPGWTQPDEGVESLPEVSGATGASVGGTQDSPVASQPAPHTEGVPSRKRGGILGALRSVLMPDPSSFMYAALNNPNGIWGAAGAQEAYRQNQTQQQLANETAQLKLEQMRTKGEYQVVGNNVFHIKPDGTTEMIGAPTQPSETQRLIEQWRLTPAGPEKDLIERAIRGYQYTPEVINQQASARQRVQAAGIAQRGAEARRTKATPGASGASGGARGGSKGVRLPAGAVVIP